MLVAVLFAALVYGVFWLVERRRVRRTAPPRPRPSPRSVAPDDDEEFLRELERRRRRTDPGDPDKTS